MSFFCWSFFLFFFLFFFFSSAVAAALGPDIEYRLREIVQEAIKFMKHAKRERLVCSDVTLALQLHNVEQLFGYRGAHQCWQCDRLTNTN